MQANASTFGVILITTLIQTALSMALLSLPITGVYSVVELGLPPALLGAQISILYIFGIVSSLLAAHFVRTLGAARTSQLALASMMVGLLLAMVPSVPTMIVAMFLMGFAYGIPNPAASHIFYRYVGSGNRNLLFSIKQAGVPLGGILAGFVTAPIAEWVSWRVSLLVPAIACAALIAGVIPFREAWDADRDRTARFRTPLAGFGMILRAPATRLIFLSGMLLSSAQLCVSTFLVLFLTSDYAFSPVVAGSMLAGVQGAGFVGRLFWGALGDRLGSGARCLLTLSLVLAVLTAVLAFIDMSANTILLIAVLLGVGMSASGWSGVSAAVRSGHRNSAASRLNQQSRHDVEVGELSALVRSTAVTGPSGYSRSPPVAWSGAGRCAKLGYAS